MKLKKDELKSICDMLVQYLDQLGIKEISFADNDDYYFKIWHEDRAFTKEFMDKPKYTLGSLADDIEFLKKLLSDKDRVPSSVDYMKLGAIFTAIGEITLSGEGSDK